VLYSHRRGGYIDETDVEVTDQTETLSDAIERITEDAATLSKALGKQVEYLATRHKLIGQMMDLEADAKAPLKTLEKRAAVLQQIVTLSSNLENRLGWDVKRTTVEALKERVELIETIKRLEPGEAAPIKTLRERARLLERIELADADSEARDGIPVVHEDFEARRDRLEDEACDRAIAVQNENA
jgi:hypothetical protein